MNLSGTIDSGTDSGTNHSGIALRGIAKSFAAKRVLVDVTATLPFGRVYGLLGANGVGKTTLMALIAGHLRADRGEALLDGGAAWNDGATARRTCLIREDQVYPTGSIAKSLRVMGAVADGWDEPIAERLLSRFGLPLAAEVHKLSRGERSAVNFCLAVASGAPYTFLDEPTLGMDASFRDVLYEELIAAADGSRTFMLSTHLVDEVTPIIEDVLLLAEGQIVLYADAEQAAHEGFTLRGSEPAVRGIAGARPFLTMSRLGATVRATVLGRVAHDDLTKAADIGVVLEPLSLQDFVSAYGTAAREGVVR